MAVALERDVLFPKLLTKADNRRCFDCNKANPKWCSWRFGVLICMDCAALHRQMGVHISQVKSCELDEWDYEQLCVYECSGGNKRAKDFFAKNASSSVSGGQSGGSTAAALQVKYTCRAAEQYKKILAKEVQKIMLSSTNGAVKETDTPSTTATTVAAAEESAPAPAASKPEAATSLGPARTAAASTRRPASARRRPGGGLGATRKKKGGLGGLGAKKITSKVDDNLFTQAPEEPPAVVQAPAAAPATNKVQEAPKPLAPQPTSSGRFAQDNLELEEPEETKPVDLRGSDGHVSLNKLMNSKPPQKKSLGGIRRGQRQQQKQKAAPAVAVDDVAQQRFSGAKSISSKQFHGNNAEDELEKHQRLSKFQGATSISSADYYGNASGNSSPRSDVDASELIGRLSMQAKVDLQNMKSLAGQAKSKLFNFARDMQNRYG